MFDGDGEGAAFSELAGAEGIVVDRGGTYGGGLLASRPNGGGYAGDDSVSRVLADGSNGTPVITGIPGVHAVTVAPSGPFGGKVLVASWQSGTLTQIDAAGATVELASGLALTNYDGNVLEFSPDGSVLFVADRNANRLVCIEPI